MQRLPIQYCRTTISYDFYRSSDISFKVVWQWEFLVWQHFLRRKFEFRFDSNHGPDLLRILWQNLRETSEKLTTTVVEFKVILQHNWKQKQSFCHLACVGRLPKLRLTSTMTNLRNAKVCEMLTMNLCAHDEGAFDWRIQSHQKLVL